jgi:hypothetical protein
LRGYSGIPLKMLEGLSPANEAVSDSGVEIIKNEVK